MISEEVIRLIQDLSSDLVMIDEAAETDEWAQIRSEAGKIGERLIAENQVQAADIIQAITRLTDLIIDKQVDNLSDALTHIHNLVSVLQSMADGREHDGATVKDLLGQTGIFVNDIDGGTERARQAFDETDGVEEEFLLEIEERINGFERKLFSLQPGESDTEVVRAVFREIHTLKGEAGIVGLKNLSEFYHRTESAIESARHGELTLTEDVISVLVELTSIGRRLLRGERNESTEPEHIDHLQDQLDDAAQRAQGLAPAAQAGQADAGVDEDPDDFFAAARPVVEEEEEGAAESVASPEPVDEAAVEVEEMHTIAVDVRRLDQLMEMIGEVSMTGTHLAEMPQLQAIREISSQLADFARSCRFLQEYSSGLRMTPVRPLFQRVQRAAFDAARMRHKRIDVVQEGSDTQVDRLVIDKLNAALVHIVRNAIDHGIEAPGERRAAGKPERGTLSLRAYRTESDVVIEISEDGKGLDLDRIRQKAIDQGLITEDEQLTRRETIALIFKPGFSTAQSVTGISGRGVGMEVVKESIASLRGTMEVDTEKGKGTSFRLRFPVALAAIEGLVVRVGESTLVFPISVVRESFRVTPDQVSSVEGKGKVVNIRGVVLPVLTLGDYLSLPHAVDQIEDGVLVIVEEGERLAAVLVDNVVETRQVVIRPLEGRMNDLPDITGAALLPDRRVALIVDTRRLLDGVNVSASREFSEASSRQVNDSTGVEVVEIGSNAVGMIDFVVYSDDGRGGPIEHVFAINAFKAREFVPVSELTDMPNAPYGFAGMLLLRNATIPVVSLGTLLGLVGEDSRNPEWERIIVICEFSGQTVGFLVSHVNRVSYISWNDIMPPPNAGGLVAMEYVVGAILKKCLGQTERGRAGSGSKNASDESGVAMVLDFELIVQKVLHLYDDIGADLAGVQQRKLENSILLVEDSPLIRRQTAVALENAGMQVLTAENGQVAVNMIDQMYRQAKAEGKSIFSYIDLVLSDIEMPILDGYSLVLHIKNHPELRVLPVLLHSSLTNDTMISRAKEVRADGFVPKCAPKELADQLRKYL